MKTADPSLLPADGHGAEVVRRNSPLGRRALCGELFTCRDEGRRADGVVQCVAEDGGREEKADQGEQVQRACGEQKWRDVENRTLKDHTSRAAREVSAPMAQRVPAAKRRESPGRNGVTTRP